MTLPWDDGEDPRRLAGMLGEAQVQWSDADLAAMLRHQLSGALAEELVPGQWIDAAALARLADRAGISTFRDLFVRPAPLELLEAVKSYAKDIREHTKLTTHIRRALYFAVLALAQVQLGARISRLGDDELRAGWRWCLEQPWLDSDFRLPIERALASLPQKLRH